jgi:acid phosphatase
MPTLASELLAARRTFIGYAESLPYPGYVGCFGRLGSLLSPYYKRHVPWAFFTRANYLGLAKSDTHGLLLPDSADQPWSAFPEPDAYDTLPTVAMVTPNAGHDMHGYFLENDSADLTADGDEWLSANILPLERWVLDPKNDALLIVTWDESDRERGKPDTNHIPTIFVGSMVRHGTYGERIDHYSVLATLEQFYKLPRLGASAQAQPILGCWR